MLSLNPEKLFIVLIVALILLGPDKLPKLSRQVGEFWTKIRDFQQRMESEVRESVPSLPSSAEIARIARSPVSYLTTMAATSKTELVPDPAAPAAPAPPAPAPAAAVPGAVPPNDSDDWPVDRAAPVPVSTTNGNGVAQPTPARSSGVPRHVLPADPGMN